VSLFTVALDDDLRRYLADAVRVYEVERRRNGLYGLPKPLAEFREAVLVDTARNGQETTDLDVSVVTDQDQIMVSVAAAAHILGLSERTVSRRLHDGSLPSTKLGRRRLIPVKYLQELGANTDAS